MSRHSLSRVLRCGAVVALIGLFGVESAAARPKPGVVRPRQGFSLFANVFAVLEANNMQCGMDNRGEECNAPAGSPLAGGGFWPRGTPDQYIFNSGLQIAGIVPKIDGFPWSQDTVGVFFMDPRGDQAEGEGVSLIYNSIDPNDLSNWPDAAVVRDTAIFNSALVGLKTISQQDTWVRYWDGNPTLLSGRSHPMGVLVDQRSLAWADPKKQDIIFWVYTFYNITATDASLYDGIDPALRADIVAQAQKFHDGVHDKLGVTIPAGGYAFTNLYAAFFMDDDIGDAGHNYTTVSLPYGTALGYKSDFLEPNWEFPPTLFGAPFRASPGFISVKYLKSPVNPATGKEVGLTLWSNTRNASQGFPDPVGVVQMWRYLSANLNPGAGDFPCTVADPKTYHVCFADQVSADTRFFMSSGPFELDPGQSASIVVAYFGSAPVAKPLEASGQIGGNLSPGVPPTPEALAQGTRTPRTIDSVAGWLSAADSNSDGAIEGPSCNGPGGSFEGGEVKTVPNSALGKAATAQAVYCNKFLAPFAPNPPEFYVMPGNSQVTVVWQPSPTETAGDPYYTVAADPASGPLYDPNYRNLDVEGYRIYRGRTRSDLAMLAQFDYANTTFVDSTGAFDYGGSCAPELGVTAGCPTFPHTHDIVSPFVQVEPGDRTLLASGQVYTLRADTAVTGEASGFPPLTDTGVPFAYVDKSVRNSFTYYYAVTAFDVNSPSNGASSYESARITKSVTPRAPAENEVQAQLTSGLFGDDSVPLDPSQPWGINATTGDFNGPPPPTDAIKGAFAPLVPQLLPKLSLTARIDSLTAEGLATGCTSSNALGACYTIYLTFIQNGAETPYTIPTDWPVWDAFGEPNVLNISLGNLSIPADSASAAKFGIPDGFASFNATVGATLREYILFSSFEGQAARRNLIGNGAGISPGGSRWFDGTTDTVLNPTYGIRVGHLAGVDSVWAPIHHTDTDPTTPGVQSYAASSPMQCFGYLYAGLGREADVELQWQGGQVTVRDVTHHVDVPYSPKVRASYGFVSDANGNGYIDWRDFDYIDGVAQNMDDANGPLGFCSFTDPGAGGRISLAQQPTVTSVSTSGGLPPAGATGQGFGLYIDGERYIFQLAGGNLPADGTIWTLRTYAGLVSASSGAETTAPTGYKYNPTDRPPIIPGLQVVFNVPAATTLAPPDSNLLANVHTVPDPYYTTSALEATPNTKVLKFVHLPAQAIIRIYSVSGILLRVLYHNDPTNGGEQTWDLRTRNNQFLASGVYFFHVESPDGQEKVGRFTVIDYTQ